MIETATNGALTLPEMFILSWIKLKQQESASKGEGKKGAGYKGVNPSWDGLNTEVIKAAMRGDLGECNITTMEGVIELTRSMEAKGLLSIRPSRGGSVRMYLAEEEPSTQITQRVLAAMMAAQ